MYGYEDILERMGHQPRLWQVVCLAMPRCGDRVNQLTGLESSRAQAAAALESKGWERRNGEGNRGGPPAKKADRKVKVKKKRGGEGSSRGSRSGLRLPLHKRSGCLEAGLILEGVKVSACSKNPMRFPTEAFMNGMSSRGSRGIAATKAPISSAGRCSPAPRCCAQ